jgi:hypothetical protein
MNARYITSVQKKSVKESVVFSLFYKRRSSFSFEWFAYINLIVMFCIKLCSTKKSRKTHGAHF